MVAWHLRVCLLLEHWWLALIERVEWRGFSDVEKRTSPLAARRNISVEIIIYSTCNIFCFTLTRGKTSKDSAKETASALREYISKQIKTTDLPKR